MELLTTKENVKILHVVPYFYPAWSYGGPPRAVYEIAKEQVKAHHDVSVLTTTAYQENETLPAGNSTIDGISVTRLKNISNKIMWNYHFCTPIGIKEYFVAHSFECIHLHEVRTALNYYSLLYSDCTDFVLSPWGTLPYNDSMIFIKKNIDTFLLPLMRNKIRISFAQTNHEKDVLEEYKIGKKNEVIPLGINFSSSVNFSNKSKARKKLNLDADAFYYLFLGRFSPYKGIEILLKSFVSVLNVYPKSKLLLVGRDDGYMQKIMELIREFSISDSVEILENIYGEERFYTYFAADAFVFTPTVYEETGTATLESLSCGTPVLTTIQAEIPFLNENDGVITTKNSVADISIQMLKMQKLPLVVNTSKIESHFSWQKISNVLLKHYANK